MKKKSGAASPPFFSPLAILFQMEVDEDSALDNHIMLITGNVIDGQDLDMLDLPAILNSKATADELQVQLSRLVARSVRMSLVS
jgi:hypothetical protein